MRARFAATASVLLASASIWCAAVGFAQDDHEDVPAPPVNTPRNAAGLTNPIAQLSRRLVAGQATLTYAPTVGLLPSVLRELQIPVASQTLVFSKTSLQSQVITSRTPRALYFNDTVYVGYVPDGTLLELAAVDPRAGAVFYTISQSPGARPRLVTNADCVQCHATPATLGLPGFLLRSVFVRPDGQVAPNTRSYLTDHTSPLWERWGGWYITGTIPGPGHMGNAFLRQGEDESTFDRRGATASTLLGQFDRARYLSPESDVVALLVLDHQAQMHNLISRLRYTVSQGLPLGADVEALVRYALFDDEAPLPGPITGTTSFAADFERLGPHDASGRSLRQFDLKTRLFRYPCSFLLYSDEFTGLPGEARSAVLARLDAVLSGRDASGTFSRLSAADRAALREILTETLPGFAALPRP
jgi:hypothetical protein